MLIGIIIGIIIIIVVVIIVSFIIGDIFIAIIGAAIGAIIGFVIGKIIGRIIYGPESESGINPMGNYMGTRYNWSSEQYDNVTIIKFISSIICAIIGAIVVGLMPFIL